MFVVPLEFKSKYPSVFTMILDITLTGYMRLQYKGLYLSRICSPCPRMCAAANLKLKWPEVHH